MKGGSSLRNLIPFGQTRLMEFRRSLRGEDKIAFDSLMNKTRAHTLSCTVTPMLEPMDAVFLSILVEQQKEINSLREAVNGGKPESYI